MTPTSVSVTEGISRRAGVVSVTAVHTGFVAGLLALPRDADDTARVALAARIGLPSDSAARILDKTPAAMQKAYERARKRGK